jgi:hypothetical protein
MFTRRKIRGLAVLAGILGALEIIYVAGTAVFLNTSLTKLINTDSQSLWITYASAFSIFPGIVRVRDVKVRVQDHNMQLHAELHHATVGIHLFALFNRKFQTTFIQGGGVSFRLRFRRPLKEIMPEKMALLAPIPGLLSLEKIPEVKDPHPSEPWKISLGGLNLADLYEVWIEDYHFLGKGLVTGGFYLYPSHEAEVFSSGVEITEGNVFVGKEVILGRLRTAVEGRIRRFKGDEVPGREIFRYTTGKIDYQSDVKTIRFLNEYLSQAPWINVDGASGPLQAQLSMQDGNLKTNSWIKFSSTNLKVNVWQQQILGRGALEWRVICSTKDPEGLLKITLPRFDVYDPRRGPIKVTGKDLSLEAKSPNLALQNPFRPLSIRIALPFLEVEDLTAANLYLPKGAEVKFLGGSAFLHGEFEANTDAPSANHGKLAVQAKQAIVKIGSEKSVADVSLKTVLAHGNMQLGELNLTGTEIEISNVKGTKKDPESANWWAKARLAEADVRIKNPKKVRAILELKGRDAKPILQAYLSSEHSSLPGLVKSALAFKGLSLTVELEADDERLAIQNFHATGEHTDVKGWLEKSPDGQAGKFLVEYGPLAAGLDFRPDGVHLRLEDAYTWFRKQTK